ncbi:MAG TPA: aminomethyl-transferring glycine dehydrogenase subunit GcvPB [Firmicutes bacterium]|nr:aminomethyl-transferring glycine dehydrogenase subunit GcvPB [Bacillota bacterium]
MSSVRGQVDGAREQPRPGQGRRGRAGDVVEPLIFELGSEGRRGYSLPECDVPERRIEDLIPPECLRRDEPHLPEVSEVEVIRHFTRLSQLNYGVDVGFYPLGSCTMKYNPKVNEDVAGLPGFTRLHPYEPEELVQGALELMYELEGYLAAISGMTRVTLQPAAGAHGELTGLMMIKAYHEHRGEGGRRRKVIIPDSAHGTNPASATLCGYQVVEVKSDERGGVDIADLRALAGEDTAALMLTNPNTLGLFDENIVEIARIVHDSGGLLYYDGANMNATLGIARPGDMGFDVVHFNLHKTFSTPHGGGGPGAGPVGVKAALEPFLPVPTVEREVIPGEPAEREPGRGYGGRDGSAGQGGGENGGAERVRYWLNFDRPLSIGRIRSFYGNFGVLVKAYAYIRALGAGGLRRVAENAVLNANYVMRRLSGHYILPYDRHCKHEFVLSGKDLAEHGIHTMDVAKALLDYGFHAPTIYFPDIIKEAIMIEPTETEPKEMLDAFVDAMIDIKERAAREPEKLKAAPETTVVGRLDEVTAARRPKLRWSLSTHSGPGS